MKSSRPATNRANRGQLPSRGRGGRERGSGFRDGDDNYGSSMRPVPTATQVITGVPVSIVLKIDQVTGQEVQGIVADVLTSGNHPRGIKVRLQDGRVGRVQRMVSEETAALGSQGMSGLGRNGELGRDQAKTTLSGSFSIRRYGDFRVGVPEEPPNAESSLSDYVVVKSAKRGRGKNNRAQNKPEELNEDDQEQADGPSIKSTMSTCPVCGDFEGDEVAVAYHVNKHFE